MRWEGSGRAAASGEGHSRSNSARANCNHSFTDASVARKHLAGGTPYCQGRCEPPPAGRSEGHHKMGDPKGVLVVLCGAPREGVSGAAYAAREQRLPFHLVQSLEHLDQPRIDVLALGLIVAVPPHTFAV